MIRNVEVDGFILFYESSKVNAKEAEEVARKEIEATKKFFANKPEGWPVRGWYNEKRVPVYHDVVYLLTDRGWLSDKQRADIIRQGNSSPDYEIIEPIQTKTKSEISHYETKRELGGYTEVSLNKAVHLYWFYTGQCISDEADKVLKESRYSTENKPLDYLTEEEWESFFNNQSLKISEGLSSGILSDDTIKEFESMNDLI